MEINVNGSTHFSLPLGGVDFKKVNEQVREMLSHQPKRELGPKDLEQWDSQILSLTERIASCKATASYCEKELKALHTKIDELESKCEKLEPLATTRPAVHHALVEHKAKLEQLQEAVTAWIDRRDCQVRIAASSQKILDGLPWADIKRLRDEQRLLGG